MVLRTICLTDKLLAAKDADIIRSKTGRLAAPRMLEVTIALKQGYFAECCRAKSRVNMVSEVKLAETFSSDSEAFLGGVSALEHKPWTADIIVNQDCVTFKKLDSRA